MRALPMATILVIDDDASMRRTLVRILGPEHNVIEAQDGSVGLALFATHAPELVITDIVMPKKEGIETILELRRRAPGLRIIAISGGGEIRNADYLDMAEKLGADAAMPKPLRVADLRETVNRLLSVPGLSSCTF